MPPGTGFPFRRPLRPGGLRWRYTTPPPHGFLILAAGGPRYIASRRTDRKHRFLYCCEAVFTALLHNNGSYSIIACVFIAAGTFLPSRCLAKNIYCDYAIPTFGRHVTIYKYRHRPIIFHHILINNNIRS
jgi:hypothetical protein